MFPHRFRCCRKLQHPDRERSGADRQNPGAAASAPEPTDTIPALPIPSRRRPTESRRYRERSGADRQNPGVTANAPELTDNIPALPIPSRRRPTESRRCRWWCADAPGISATAAATAGVRVEESERQNVALEGPKIVLGEISSGGRSSPRCQRGTSQTKEGSGDAAAQREAASAFRAFSRSRSIRSCRPSHQCSVNRITPMRKGPPNAMVASIHTVPPILGEQCRAEQESAEAEENQQPGPASRSVGGDHEIDRTEDDEKDPDFPANFLNPGAETKTLRRRKGLPARQLEEPRRQMEERCRQPEQRRRQLEQRRRQPEQRRRQPEERRRQLEIRRRRTESSLRRIRSPP